MKREVIDERELWNSQNYYEENLSLYVCRGTSRAARLSCGGVIDASLAVARGELGKAFAIVRPPGHHANMDETRLTGFCTYNNIAIANLYARKAHGLKKALIFDWDVHHGDSTEKIFYSDPNTLFMTIHKHHFYVVIELKVAITF